MGVRLSIVSSTKTPAVSLGAMVSALVLAAVGLAQDDSLPPPGSARDVLARYDIGPAQFAQLIDGSPIAGDEEEILAKILLRYSRLGADNIHRWRKTDASWEAVAAAVHQEQGELFAIRGRAKLVTEHKLPAELAQRFEFARYYSVRIVLDGSSRELVVYARAVPKAWQIGAALEEPAIADGLLLKLGPAEDGRQPLVFATQRVGWLPESSPLARAGFDVGLFDAVRETNGKGLLAADREPFYQLLSAIDRVEHEDGAKGAAALDVVPLLEKPADHQGEFFAVRGTARRVVRIAVSEAGVRERLSLDHYFEIDLFVPLGDARLRFDEGKRHSESPVFESTYPVTLIARQLPPGLTEGENLHAEVAADAVFFKLWTYESAYMSRYGRVQPAPLFVTPAPRLIPAANQSSGIGGSIITALLVAMLVATFAAYWSYQRGDRAHCASSLATSQKDPSATGP